MTTSDIHPTVKNDTAHVDIAYTPMNITLRCLRQQLHRRSHKADDEGNATPEAQMSNTRLQVAMAIALPSPHNLTPLL